MSSTPSALLLLADIAEPRHETQPIAITALGNAEATIKPDSQGDLYVVYSIAFGGLPRGGVGVSFSHPGFTRSEIPVQPEFVGIWAVTKGDALRITMKNAINSKLRGNLRVNYLFVTDANVAEALRRLNRIPTAANTPSYITPGV